MQWNALRVGVIGEARFDRVRLSLEGAYLPVVSVDGVDRHWNRPDINPGAEWGRGDGYFLEGIASYDLTPSVSVGVGGRYWRMQTDKGSTTAFPFLPAQPDQVPDRALRRLRAALLQAGRFRVRRGGRPGRPGPQGLRPHPVEARGAGRSRPDRRARSRRTKSWTAPDHRPAPRCRRPTCEKAGRVSAHIGGSAHPAPGRRHFDHPGGGLGAPGLLTAAAGPGCPGRWRRAARRASPRCPPR